MTNKTEKYRRDIAKKVREIRHARQWTQKAFAELLGLSQNRFSEIERGQGSFTAEQLLLLSKTFNVPVSEFASVKGRGDQKIQNALARHGAKHLLENQESLPSEKLDDVVHLVHETLVAADSPRQIAALGPVIVNHATPANLNKLRIRFNETGLTNRFGWLLENIRFAINKEQRDKSLSIDWKRKFAKADLILNNILGLLSSLRLGTKDEKSTDILDNTIADPKTFKEVREASSTISKEWRIITRLQPEDFLNALKDARETH